MTPNIGEKTLLNEVAKKKKIAAKLESNVNGYNVFGAIKMYSVFNIIKINGYHIIIKRHHY